MGWRCRDRRTLPRRAAGPTGPECTRPTTSSARIPPVRRDGALTASRRRADHARPMQIEAGRSATDDAREGRRGTGATGATGCSRRDLAIMAPAPAAWRRRARKSVLVGLRHSGSDRDASCSPWRRSRRQAGRARPAGRLSFSCRRIRYTVRLMAARRPGRRGGTRGDRARETGVPPRSVLCVGPGGTPNDWVRDAGPGAVVGGDSRSRTCSRRHASRCSSISPAEPSDMAACGLMCRTAAADRLLLDLGAGWPR